MAKPHRASLRPATRSEKNQAASGLPAVDDEGADDEGDGRADGHLARRSWRCPSRARPRTAGASRAEAHDEAGEAEAPAPAGAPVRRRGRRRGRRAGRRQRAVRERAGLGRAESPLPSCTGHVAGGEPGCAAAAARRVRAGGLPGCLAGHAGRDGSVVRTARPRRRHRCASGSHRVVRSPGSHPAVDWSHGSLLSAPSPAVKLSAAEPLRATRGRPSRSDQASAFGLRTTSG